MNGLGNLGKLDMASGIFGMFMSVWWAKLVTDVLSISRISLRINPDSLEIALWLFVVASTVWIGAFVYCLFVWKCQLSDLTPSMSAGQALGLLTKEVKYGIALALVLFAYLLAVNLAFKSLAKLSVGIGLLLVVWLVVDIALIVSATVQQKDVG